MTEKLKFEFAKYTEITDLAFKINPNYKKSGYIRFFSSRNFFRKAVIKPSQQKKNK